MFRRFIRAVKRLFRGKPVDRDITTRPSKPLEPNTGGVNGKKIHGILMFVGHYNDAYGTRTYNKIKEMHSNLKTAEMLASGWTGLLTDVELEVARRRKSNYKSHCKDSRKQIKDFAKRIGCKPENILAIEMHYNAASVPKARGGYFMLEKGDQRSVIAGQILIDHFVNNTPMTYRKDYQDIDGLEGMDSGRGFGWIDYCNDDGAMSLLFEPFFCDYMNEETAWLFGKEKMTEQEREYQMIHIAEKMTDLWEQALLKVLRRFNG